MKKLGIFLMAIFLLGCQSKSKKIQTTISNGTSNADSSINVQKDKRNFMDFFIHFMSDSAFQKEHVSFPARMHQKTSRTKEHWIPRSFSKEKGFHSLLQSDTLDYFETDFGEEPINVSIVSFETLTIQNLSFNPAPEDWHLDKNYKSYISENSDYEFFVFLNNFTLDSIFQKENIRFPLPYFHLDYKNDYETLKDTFSVDTWKYINLDKSLKELFTLNQNENSDYRPLFLRGIANGVHIKYTFKRLQKQWELIKIEDYST
ncbi:DUF4348 domain-containing protein [Maribacter sp. 4G9]|uniref:DUF4348 domain-containing protein n=1 Tax=Maribacter sp. 4G9 TaxID=1889777 RepID=UPI000C1609A9|nr:DUF4348 domain-containing protein [Maribacter sp. 4G9]PIB38403.1 hypothetical protein BFP75_15970 [Maribacter sp. 4G9]